MIICRLQGGLGNQMLQYACTRSLSLQTGQPFCFDLSFLNDTSITGMTMRSLELQCFNLPLQLAGYWDLRKMVQPYSHTGRSFWIRWERKAYRKWRKFTNRKMISDEHAHLYDERVFSDLTCKGYFLHGYFFSFRYFERYRKEILADFRPKKLSNPATEALREIQSSPVSCSLHVRRGDYITNPNAAATHGLCSMDYYREAIRRIADLYPNVRFFCFSDDLEWCKEHFEELGSSIVYVENVPEKVDFEDMILMSKCNHNIIANSTFSWWGAWLNENPDKQVFAPRNIFATPVDTTDCYPSQWHII